MKYNLICATTRTGSSLLADLLRSTGIAGNPKEYFTQWQLNQLKSIKTEQDFFDYVLEQSVGKNNVGSSKIFSVHIPLFLKFASNKNINVQEIPHIWLQRKDKIRQAISNVKAHKIGFHWDHGFSESEIKAREMSIHITVADIEKWIVRISLYEMLWHQYFTEYEIIPYIIYYEDIAQPSQWDNTIRSILDFLQIDYIEPIRVSTNRTIQSTNFNENLYQEFISHYPRIYGQMKDI